MVKLEKRGFGRTETITLILISSATGKSFKDYAKRRMKDKVLLKDLALEAGMDYSRLYEKSRKIKIQFEAKGETDLPPPVFEPPPPAPTPAKKKKKKEESKQEMSPPDSTPTPDDSNINPKKRKSEIDL